MTINLYSHLYNHKTDINPKPGPRRFPELTVKLIEKNCRTSKDGPAWSPAVLAPGTTRANANVISISALVLDIDGFEPHPVKAALQRMELNAVLHSTFSHTADHPCFRLVVELTRPLTPAEAPVVWDAFNAKLCGVADAKTKDLARLYYLPTHQPDHAGVQFALTLKGKPLDVDVLLAEVAATKKKTQKHADSNGRINRRAIADGLHQQFNGELWFYQGEILCYSEGWWQPLPTKQLVSLVLTTYEGTVREDADAAIKTLEGLCHQEVAPPEEFQTLICMANGTLDPVTRELLPHSPEHRQTYALPFAWDPEAKATQYDGFLKDVWGAEPDFEERVRCSEEFGGQIFLPSNRYGHFVWLLGGGANGKSVLSRVFEHVVGNDNVSHVALERLSKASSRAHIAEKLLNVSSEIGAEATLADGFFKAMVTGDATDAERKYKDPYTVHPRVKFLASTNHLPRLRDNSDGFKRRGIILTFPRTFSREEQDPYLEDKLRAEAPGILVSWINGLQRLMERGYVLPPPSSDVAMKEYRLESDPIGLFVEERLMPDTGRGTPTGELFELYREWAQAGNYGVPNASRFGRALTNLGYPVTSKSNGVPYRGLQLRNGSESDGQLVDRNAPKTPTKGNLSDAFDD